MPNIPPLAASHLAHAFPQFGSGFQTGSIGVGESVFVASVTPGEINVALMSLTFMVGMDCF